MCPTQTTEQCKSSRVTFQEFQVRYTLNCPFIMSSYSVPNKVTGQRYIYMVDAPQDPRMT